MKGTNLGEFEELVLLIVANLFDDAYGVAIRDEIESKCQRSVSLSTVHAALHRLNKKGFLHSRYDRTAIGARGGRPKLVFNVTKSGQAALEHARNLRNQLWDSIPPAFFEITK